MTCPAAFLSPKAAHPVLMPWSNPLPPGHTHAANYYQWSGFDVINTPCTQGDAAWNGPPDPQVMQCSP